MTWQYNQRTGQLQHNGNNVSVGYSGRNAGYNNPLMETTQSIGPIPRGRYRIGPQHTHPSKGPITMALTPIGHNAHGRTNFLIHGDSIQHPGQASEGCIVLNHAARQAIAHSADNDIEVIQ
jgi:hypothetical protein